MVRPTTAETFSEYMPHHIVPFLAMEARIKSGTQRIDTEWDHYPEHIGDGSTAIPNREWNCGFLKM